MPKKRKTRKPRKIKKAVNAVSRKIAFNANAFALIHPAFRKFFKREPKMLELKNLKPGNLFFFRISRGRLREVPFNLAIGSPFGHVAMYVGENKMMHINLKKGVHLTSLDSLQNVPFIFRVEMNSKQREAVVKNILRQQGKPYSRGIKYLSKLQGALRIKVKNPKIEGYSCANVIAESFAEAGIDLVPGVHPLRQGIHYLFKSKKLNLMN